MTGEEPHGLSPRPGLLAPLPDVGKVGGGVGGGVGGEVEVAGEVEAGGRKELESSGKVVAEQASSS